MRDTSIAAYEAIKNDGTLGHRQIQVLEILEKHGPLTGNEICQKAGIPGLWKRCSELEEMGLIKTLEKRRCSVTGRQAVVWAIAPAAAPKQDTDGQFIMDLGA